VYINLSPDFLKQGDARPFIGALSIDEDAVSFSVRAFEDEYKHAPALLKQLDNVKKIQVYINLSPDFLKQGDARPFIGALSIDEDAVSFSVRAFEDEYKHAPALFKKLNADQKLQVRIAVHPTDSCTHPTVRSRWVYRRASQCFLKLSPGFLKRVERFFAGVLVTQAWRDAEEKKLAEATESLRHSMGAAADEHSNDDLRAKAKKALAVAERARDEANSRIELCVREARDLYHENVSQVLGSAFVDVKDVWHPNFNTLVAVATTCRLKGEPEDVLRALVPHLQARIEVVKDLWRMAKNSKDQCDRRCKLDRLNKGLGMLQQPEDRVKKSFRKVMPSSMLPPSPSSAMPVTTAMGTAALPLPALPPPAAQAAPPVPLALPPPSPNSYLRSHILPRPNCAKCAVARGHDASVRAEFAKEGGKGRNRDVSLKRACPLYAHAINSDDGVKLLEERDREYGGKLTNKKQKFEDFMRSEFGVERLGPKPNYAVSLYETRVGAALAVEGGGVKLNFRVGYAAVAEAKPKNNYAGFIVV
jgi:hypothetical protein